MTEAEMRKMQVVRIDVKEEYKKKFSEREKKKFLDYVFDHNLFPRGLYLPAGAFIRKGYLSLLLGYVSRIHMLQNQGELSLEKVAELSCGGDLMIKNQDDIFEEKGEIIMTQCGPHAHSQADQRLLKLYPQRKPHYLAFDAVKINGKPYYVLIQVGFLRDRKIRIVDTLPKIDNILKDEKLILCPLFEDILKKMLFQIQYFCPN